MQNNKETTAALENKKRVAGRFTRTVNGNEFSFHVFFEGNDEVCRITVNNQDFKMIVGNTGEWIIRQQVPSWIRQLEQELAKTIENA